MTPEELEKLPQYGTSELKLPEVRLFQSREHYKLITGKEAPVYYPNYPNKYWDIPNPSTPRISYHVLDQTDPNKPTLTLITILAKYAMSVNIPSGATNAEEIYSNTTEPLPIRPLLPHEELILGFGGIILVKNNKVIDPSSPTTLNNKLNLILDKLDILLSRFAGMITCL